MQEFEFQINYDERSYTIRKYKGDDQNVVVPGIYGGKPVTILFDSVFAGHDEIYSISFPDTITDLGEFVFEGCSNLKHIELPKSLTSLWGYTFARSAIEEITLPDGVGIIPPYAFKDCKALKKVVCGSGMRKIKSWAFGGCDSLSEVIYGPDVEVSKDAFETNQNILRIQY